MKSISKLVYLFGGLVLGGVFVVSIVNKVVAEEFVMPTMNSDVVKQMQSHRVHLTNLWLGDGDEYDKYARLSAGESNLNVLNGLFVGEGTVGDNATLVVVGGGDNNTINGSSAGIAGGSTNTISANNSAIGGGINNTVNGENGVVAGGNSNTVGSGGGVVVGGNNNSVGEYGVVVGGSSNFAGKYGLAFGRSSKGGERSFSWNDGSNESYTAKDNSAYIGTSGGVLIGTYTPVSGVNLVVNGAVKIGGEELGLGKVGEVKMVNGCFYAHDGSKWHVLGRGSVSASSCRIEGLAKICEFGNTRLWEGDIAIGYSAPYAPNCNDIRQVVSCGSDGNLDPAEYVYPYCYSLNGDSGIDRCYDFNGDGTIDDSDVMWIAEKCVLEQSIPDECNLADFDGDTIINVVDIANFNALCVIGN